MIRDQRPRRLHRTARVGVRPVVHFQDGLAVAAHVEPRVETVKQADVRHALAAQLAVIGHEAVEDVAETFVGVGVDRADRINGINEDERRRVGDGRAGLRFEQRLGFARRMVLETHRETGFVAEGTARRQVLKQLPHEGALQGVAVEIALEEFVLRHQWPRGAVVPTARVNRSLVLNRGLRADRLDRAGANLGELAQPLLTLALEPHPSLIRPVHRPRQFTADLVAPASLAVRAVADAHPEGHVEADAVAVVARGQLAGPGADVFPIRRVGADEPMPATLPERAAVGMDDPPVRMLVGRPAVMDHAHVKHHGDAALVATLDHLRHDVAALQPGVLPAHFGWVVEQTDMRLRVADDGLRAGLDERFHVAVRVELGQEPGVPIRDVHVNHRPPPRGFKPARTGAR